MAKNVLHSSETGLIVGGSPNVNAMYGPWESVQTATAVLEENFSVLDDNFNLVPKVPVGTTVAVYNNSYQDSVTEYWWTNDGLVLKTYGNNYYELLIQDQYGKDVNTIIIKDGYVEPQILKLVRRDNSRNTTVDIGIVKYSINGGEFLIYDFSSNSGISTDSITTSIIFEWRDSGNNLILYRDLTVIAPPTISQNFYAYNNDEINCPAYRDSGLDYQSSGWTPNHDSLEEEIWSLKRTGITRQTPVEWEISRARVNGIWEPIVEPIITAVLGKDGANITNQQFLWAYSLFNDSETKDILERSLDELEITGDNLDDSYPVIFDGHTVIWYSKFQSLSLENRYCYLTYRSKYDVDGSIQYTKWTTPEVYSYFPVDGKDGDSIEYIYCLSNTSELSDEAKAELNKINEDFATYLDIDRPGGKVNLENFKYWTDDPSGISDDMRYEFCSTRSIQKESSGLTIYGEFSTPPVLWASFGKEGPDGPGIEYIYALSTGIDDKPSPPDSGDSGFQEDNYAPRPWKDNPQEVSYSNPILWMSQRKSKDGVWQAFSDPVIWNQYTLNYEIKLSNDNCSIPASKDGSYTADAAKSATVTQVQLYLGNTLIEGVEFETSVKYGTLEDNRYYLEDLSLEIDSTYNVEFRARIEGKVVATKYQTISLNRSQESYMLQCIPNSRIWYGGTDYSTTMFSLKLFKINLSGQYEEINDFSNYKITYQFSGDSNTLIIKNPSEFIHIPDGQNNNIYLTLWNDGKIVDTETIDCVDYSRIKGADNTSVLFNIDEQINIPKIKSQDSTYIKNLTKTTPRAYINTTEIPSEKLTITAQAIYLDSITGAQPNLVNENSKTFYIDGALEGDVGITYSIEIDIDGEPQHYDVAQIINLTDTQISYSLFTDTNIITYNPTGGFSTDSLRFTVICDSNDKPNYWIKYKLLELNTEEEYLGENVDSFNLSQISNNLTEDKTYHLSFELYVNDKLEDIMSVAIISEPELEGYNYTIDLDNPFVSLPSSGLEGDALKTWTLNTFTVYQGHTQIQNGSENGYPYYLIETAQSGITIENNTSYLTTIPSTDIIIYYTVTIFETEDISYTFTKSQTIKLTDQVSYKLISNPSTVVADYGAEGKFKYEPKVSKFYNGTISELNIGDEGTYYTVGVGTSPWQVSRDLLYKEDTVSYTIRLYNSKGELLDLDTIPVIRNGQKGADGISVEYIYGRIEEDAELDFDLNTSNITTLTKETFQSNLNNEGIYIDDLGIEWYDEPKGINATYLREFQSYSKFENGSWSNFSTPIIHSEFGKKGEDGNGIEYIYVACKGLTIDANNNYTIEYGNTTEKPTGSLLNSGDVNDPDNADGFIPDGWFDDIQNLSRENPKLYVSIRKKKKGKWTDFSNPVLWNTYNTSLELLLDNNIVIIDDNSTDNTIKEVSATTVQVYYLGNSIDQSTIEPSLSQELGELFELNQNGNQFSLSLLEGKKLYETSGQITYTVQHAGLISSISQQVQVKNFSAGDAYKLVLIPNVIHGTYKDGVYNWQNQEISVTALKISGSTSSKATDVVIKVNDTVLEGDTYTLLEGSSENVPQYIFNIEKGGVLVESQTLAFSTRGKDGIDGIDGKDGEDGKDGTDGADGKNASLRIAGEWNNTTTYYCQQEDGNVLYTDVVTYKNNNKLQFYSAKQTNTNKIPTEHPECWDPVAHSDVTLTQQLLIYNDDAGNISGGFVDVENQQSDQGKTADGIILWAGGNGTTELDSANSATFSVTRSGVLRAKEGLFEGMYASKTKCIDDSNVKFSNIIDLRTVCTWDDGYLIPRLIDMDCLAESIVFTNFTAIKKDDESNLLYESVGNLTLVNESKPLVWDPNVTLKLPSGVIFIPWEAHKDTHQSETFLQRYFEYSATGNVDLEIGASHNLNYSSSINNSVAYTYCNPVLYEWLTGKTVGSSEVNTMNELLYDDENTFATKLQEYQQEEFKRALPYVGKKITLINFPGKLWGILKYDESAIPDTNVYDEIGQYFATGVGAYQGLTDSTSTVIQVECKLGCIGNPKSEYNADQLAYYIYWEEIYKSPYQFDWKTESMSLPTINLKLT